MFKIAKLFLFFILMFLLISCGYEQKKYFPMPVLDGLVVVVPFSDQVNTGIKKTGQNTSYNESGDQITNGSVKDDGYYQMGTAHDYGRDNANKIVFDHITKLAWQDNEDAKTSTMSWPDAKNYCENLVMGPYSDWYLPSIVELQTIVKFNQTNPSLDSEVFVNYSSISPNIYWSATPEKVDALIILFINSRAWAREFFVGSVNVHNQLENHHVRCVYRPFSTN